MSLATRCPACGTAFRVVQDQLKVSEGWVRCGRCSQVFNALEALFDLEREGATGDAPADHRPDVASTESAGGATARVHPVSGAASRAADGVADADAPALAGAASAGGETGAPRYVLERPAAEDPQVPRAHRYLEDDAEEPPLEPPLYDIGTVPTTGMDLPPFVSSGPGLLHRESTFPPASGDDDADGDAPTSQGPAERDPRLEEGIDARLFGKRRGTRRHAPAPHVSARDQLDFSDARFDSDLLADDALDPSEEGAVEGPRSEPAAPEPSVTPEFVRRAEREARWRRPAVRAALGTGTFVLGALLALQAGHHFRDDAAVRWPALQPLLAAWCDLAGCTLEAPRHIDDISVENTALTRAPGDAFRLAVTLRSHGSVPVALPWVDLTLTDAGGRLIARRALAARDLRPTAPVLQPGQEVALQALVSARNARIAGYTVEIFYP